MATLRDAKYALSTFFAASHPNDKCGPNGLPLTPNSIKILGRYQYLKTIDHPHLCRYLDMVRGKHERLMVVMEHHPHTLSSLIGTPEYMRETRVVAVCYEILRALCHLHSCGIIHRQLSPNNILITSQGRVKLSKYGTYYMTLGGAYVSFPIGEAPYVAPEVLATGPVDKDDVDELLLPPVSGYNADTWSLGVVLLEMLSGRKIYSHLSLQQKLQKSLEFILTDDSPIDVICDENQDVATIFSKASPNFQLLLRSCLTLSTLERPCPGQLLQNPLFTGDALLQTIPDIQRNGFCLLMSRPRCENLELPEYDESGQVTDTDDDDRLGERSMDEVYYLWRLAGGDLESTLRKADLVKPEPPISLIARFTCREGEVFGHKRDPCELLDETAIILCQDELRQRLECIDAAGYYPLLEDESSDIKQGTLPTSPSSVDLSETASLPLYIRENDIEYQFHRIILYDRLLKAYPYKRAHIWREARVDIPPLVRGQVWATLLEIDGDVQERYDSIDKITPITTDRQIEVDVPRCHQYHELLSSPMAHKKFKRILKAWVINNPQYVYWQGLDSLCAPFLLLNFNHEALAFACLSAFIPKYLHGFFLKDNSAVIQEYLTVFSHLIAFHDPELSCHLDGIGFIPDLYAIPWFLTMYAHVFPLHKIMHLWDTLLLGNSSFPLFIGLSILHQLRDRLLSFTFNECILLFSDLPEIDIEKVVQDAIKIFCATPKSATYRQHARVTKGDKQRDTRAMISYYSHDYNQQPISDLSMDAIPLEELKSEKCARVSAEDLIELCELRGPAHSRSPTKKLTSSKPVLIILDVRSQDEYKRGTVPGSINIPFHSAFNSDGQLIASHAVATLNSRRQQVKVIVGNRGKSAANFAGELLSLGYNKVCVLHKGIDILRPTGLLTVPPADL